MLETKDNKTTKLKRKSALFFFILVVFALAVLEIVSGQFLPHNVEGYVFHSDGTTLAGNINVRINNTANGAIVRTRTTSIPPFFPFLGFYSATINGSDGHVINVTAWNATYYGFNATTLLSTTTYANITLNIPRASETNVTILIPALGSKKNTTNRFNVTANVSILGNDATNCNAAITFSNNAANITKDQTFTKSLGNINFGDFVLVTWNVSGLRQGTANITVRAYCESDDVNLDHLDFDSIYVTINDTSKPIVNLISPLNNSLIGAKNITFEYNVSEGTGLKNCSLYFDSRLNQTSYTVPFNTLVNFTLNNSPEGRHNWSVSCFDNSSNFNRGNSSTWFIHIDTVPPNITLMSPINNTALANYSILFEYNATDNFNVTNCSLILNNEIILINNTITQNISNNFTHSLTGGDYNWSINCSDGHSNIGTSGYFVLMSADLKINLSDFIFSNYFPAEGELIQINATIFNLGSANTTNNATVQFFENHSATGIRQLDGNISVNVTAGKNVTVIFNYTATIGEVKIIVLIDPPLASNGSVIESDETNNLANRTIFISSYHTYYGQILSDIVLDTSRNLSVFAWLNSSTFSGNIFAADSDSSVDFSSLHALGRNSSSGNISLDDFAELDLALNLTNLTDSINRSYTFDGIIKNLENFSVYETNIINVSVVNSTNTSNFVTGILWDTSDTNFGQYDGTQDVIFVTKVNRDSLGLYGTYDYELRVPANLRRYITPNVENSVTFYREIT